GALITQLFQVLNTHEDDREKNLDDDLNRFPHVNGALFKDSYKIPAFNKKMREHLIDAAKFNWTNISPAIFGSMFQSVMDADKRRSLGAHYTTEKNILKLIEPLFLEELQKEFATIKARKNKRATYLKAFHNKLAKLNFFDPACGCGNFLIIAYRELRLLELEVLKLLHEKDLARMKGGATELPIKSLLKLDVDQFYGIEIEEFPARIAETALWMMDHIMNTQASLELGAPFLRIPLEKSPSIRNEDALNMDWETFLPSKNCNYIMGNPPFVGHQNRKPWQISGMHNVWGNTGQVNRLDYVTCWFKKSVAFLTANKSIRIAFVSTNSIVMGEQAGILWPCLYELGAEIFFAHRTFKWNSEARGAAAVHCVIIGMAFNYSGKKRVYDYLDVTGDPESATVDRINCYLIDGPDYPLPARG
ncbi:MAG: class I SAM-dependent DNA methyltransferase, partial [Proteobacteria bacterium]|nr:class I SAM-dependent DNA methyltransferase [Pseudomonadota bacterium]